MAARFPWDGAPDVLRNGAAWLVVVVAANAVVALTLHGGIGDRLRTGFSAVWTDAGKPPPDAGKCMAWGPFANADATNAMTARIEASGGETELVEARVGARPDYMLLVGPQGSFEAARRVRGELASQAIDSHIVPSGPFAGSLEAGVFADRPRAMARLERLEELGYPVVFKELRHALPTFHLMARLDRISTLDLPPGGDCEAIAPDHHFL